MGDASDHGRPSLAQCRAAARLVRRSPQGKAVAALVRGKGISGLARSRGPLALVLYCAALEGRLVWQDLHGFALLEPPLLAPRRPWGAGLGPALLRLLDRRWETLLFLVPPSLMLLAALCLVPFPPGHAVALLLALAAVVHITVGLAAMVVVSGAELWRQFHRPGDARSVAESLTGAHWSVPLFHQEDVARADALLRRTVGRLGALVAVRAGAEAGRLGLRVDRGELAESLVLLRRGITTDAVRSHADGWDSSRVRPSGAVRDGDERVEVIVIRPPVPGPDPAGSRVPSGAFVFWYLAAVLVVTLVTAGMVAGWEREACAADGCAGRPATYPEALRWGSQRLLLNDPPDLVPATGPARTIGWLTSLMSLMTVPVAVTAVRQQVKASRVAAERYGPRGADMSRRTRLLMLVVNDEERDAVLRVVEDVNHTRAVPVFMGRHTVFRLGCISEVDLHLVQCEQGSGGTRGAALVVSAVLDRLRPDFLVMVGVCWGLRPDKSRLGDVVVSCPLRLMDHVKVAQGPDGGTVTILRGDRVPPSDLLLDRLRAARVGWDDERAVHFALMLSSSVLSDDPSVARAYLEREPDGFAAEMEGGGGYAAAAKGRVEWILVKAIADWGVGKTDTAQPAAARNAAEFVTHMIGTGALDRHTWEDPSAPDGRDPTR
ncbi:hypothetical protein [Streptomyces bullii]|uniref:Nucleoside phosphorylase domain-containing protein n=1 Tax=Streptomyces bullii TaxID=349910 RepID=A0ABW0UYR6_9ACTN